jgi:hypothetical protein
VLCGSLFHATTTVVFTDNETSKCRRKDRC